MTPLPVRPSDRAARRGAGWAWLWAGIGVAGIHVLGYPPVAGAGVLWSLTAVFWGLILLASPDPPWVDLLGFLMDGALIVSILSATGGLQSPFLFILYLKVLALYGVHLEIWDPRVAGLFTLYGWVLLGLVHLLVPVQVHLLLIHLGGLGITPLLGSILYHEFTRRERDPLTDLWNRRIGFRLLVQEVRKGIPYRLVFLDLDDFKKVNDTWGHAVGDEVLRALGARLRNRFRMDDLVIRYGGDEFVVATRAPDAEDRVRDVLQDPIQTSAGPIQVRASLAVSDPLTPNANLREVLHRLDTRLYRAKTFKQSRPSSTGEHP